MKKLGMLALGLSVALLSCAPPPFNLALTQAAITASRMTFAGEVGPIDNFSMGQGSSDMAFYPEKDPATGYTLQSGFISWTWQSSSQQIAFVASNGGSYRVVANPQGLGMNNLDPPYPGFVIQSLKGGHTNVVFSWDASMSSRFKSTVMTGDPVGNTYPPPAFADMSPFFEIVAPFFIPASNAHIRHVSIYPDPSPGNDRAYALVKNTGSGKFEEAQFDLSSFGLSNPVRIRLPGGIDLSAAIGPIPQHALYYFDPLSSTGFMNWYNAPTTSWVTWKWYEFPLGSGTAVATQLPGISRRIDALLTTGELFGTEGGVGRVYDQNGNQTAEFPLTGLCFVGEVYVAGEAQLLFSQALWFDNQLHFNVYSIPSQKVKSLQP